MNGTDFIDFAQQLAVAPHASAASLRSSASRAYYGAFHVAKEFLISLDGSFRSRNRDNEHQFVQRHLQNCGEKTIAALGQLLTNLHESRKEADYKLSKQQSETAIFARLCVERANSIKDGLAKVDDDLALKTVVTKGIFSYRKQANIT